MSRAVGKSRANDGDFTLQGNSPSKQVMVPTVGWNKSRFEFPTQAGYSVEVRGTGTPRVIGGRPDENSLAVDRDRGPK